MVDEKTSWTCPDCCVNPCNCKFFSESARTPDAGDDAQITAMAEIIDHEFYAREDGRISGVAMEAAKKIHAMNKPAQVDEAEIIRMIEQFVSDTGWFSESGKEDFITALRPYLRDTKPVCHSCEKAGIIHCAHPEECGHAEQYTKPVAGGEQTLLTD